MCILDRPRHEADLVRRVREAGSRIKFLLDGDVAGAIMAATPDTNVDLMVGIGGTPEGVLAACALKCLGGTFYGRLYPRNDDERRQRPGRRATTWTRSSRWTTWCAATTSSSPPRASRTASCCAGCASRADRATTHSLSMRSLSGAVRLIETRHRISTLEPRPDGRPTRTREGGARRRGRPLRRDRELLLVEVALRAAPRARRERRRRPRPRRRGRPRRRPRTSRPRTNRTLRASTALPPALAMVTFTGCFAAAWVKIVAGRACRPTDEPTLTLRSGTGTPFDEVRVGHRSDGPPSCGSGTGQAAAAACVAGVSSAASSGVRWKLLSVTTRRP